MQIKNSSYVILLLLFSAVNALAQTNKPRLVIKCAEKHNGCYRSVYKLQGTYRTAQKAMEALQYHIRKLRSKGLWEANIDSIKRQQQVITAYVHLGKQYQLKNILLTDNTNQPASLKSITDIRLSQQAQKSLLKKLNNSGYPFAKFRAEQITTENNQLLTKWRLDKGEYTVWDSIITKGNAKIGKRFLHNYLNIAVGKSFSEQVLQKVSQRLQALEFVEEIKPAEIEFVKNKAQVYTYLNKTKSNRFDGIIGLQSGKNSEKLEVTGEVNLLLNNTFKAGERIQFNWQKYEAKSQNLALKFMYPYIIASAGCDLQLDIAKHDSTYITTAINLGVRILQRGTRYLKVFYENRTSNLIATQHLGTATVLPDYADTKRSMWGLGFSMQHLDYPFNPKKGYRLELNTALGTHTINKNSKIPEQLYEGVRLSSTLKHLQWNTAFYLPIFKNISYALKSKGGWLSGGSLFANDLFQLGGLATLRGFNENSFRASQYVTARNELLLIPKRNTAFYLFCDTAYYKNSIDGIKHSDTPLGFGFGFNFATKSGIFSLNYAVGKQKNQSISLKEAKVHFGFVSRF